MNFITLQPTIRDLISGHPLFEADSDVIFADVGQARSPMNAALDISTTPPGKGYAIAVWPPVQGVSDEERSGVAGTESMVVVRFEVNPRMLTALNIEEGDPDAAMTWINLRIQAIVGAVLDMEQEAGGVRFQLAENAYEIANFDEGLVAYHIRFKRFAVFEFDGDTVLPPPPAFMPPYSFRMRDSETDEIVTVRIKSGQIALEYP